MDLLKKITTKTVGFTQASLQEFVFKNLQQGESAPLYRIAGVVSDIRPGVSDYGAYAKFIGQFVATTKDGRQCSSGVALLPQALSDLLQGVVQQAKEKNQSVDFAAEIGVMRSAASATGYEFTSAPLMDFVASDRLAKLLGSVGMAPQLAHTNRPDPLESDAEKTARNANGNKVKKAA